MEKIRLGRTGMMLTKIGFGGIPIQRLSPEAALKVVLHAFASGMNWCDTAHGYGHSEEVIGRALKKINRETVHVFTKGFSETREGMKEIVETSFKRLDTEYIDLFQVHNARSTASWQRLLQNGVVDLLLDYKQHGRIRHLGASAHTQDGAMAALSSPMVETLQWPFNFIVADESRELHAKCEKSDTGFIAMKPLGGGMIGNGPLCVRYLCQFPTVVLDPGFETTDEIDELVQECAQAADPEWRSVRFEKDRGLIAIVKDELGKSFCHRCEYCSPCANGVKIVLLMTMRSMLKRLSPDKLFRDWLPGVVASHTSCTECGICQTRCPYELPIMTQIREGVRLWEEARAEWEKTGNR